MCDNLQDKISALMISTGGSSHLMRLLSAKLKSQVGKRLEKISCIKMGFFHLALSKLRKKVGISMDFVSFCV